MTLGRKLTKLKTLPLHMRPNMRTVFYREHWGERREQPVPHRRTYRAVVGGQETTVRVLPSAMEATPEEWELFLHRPKFPEKVERSERRRVLTLEVKGYEHYELMDDEAFEATLLKRCPGEDE